METVVQGGGPLVLENLFELPELTSVKWEPFREGIEIHLLYESADGPTAALLRYAPGAALQRHVHRGHEHILVLRGSQIDESGEHFAGTLMVYLPGSSHSITSPSGCVVLLIWARPVAFIAPKPQDSAKCEIR